MNTVITDYRYASRVSRMKSSAIREILKVTEQPDIISFAGGLPAPELFPLDAFRTALWDVTTGDSSILQYSTTEGHGPLREQITQHLAEKGIKADPKEVLLTNGSQQALDLIAKIFLDPGDAVIVESPSYLGALQVFDSYEARLVQVETDNNGILIDALEEAIRRDNPKFIYLTPTFKNPTGITIPKSRRMQIIELIEKYGVLLIEDNPYGDLRYSGEPIAPIKSMDTSGHVLYLGTFSKTVAPGLRIGWITAPHPIISKLVMAKQGTDLHTSTIVQRALSRYLETNDTNAHIEKIKAAYGNRCNIMLKTLKETFPSDITWTHPDGGMFLWVTLSPEMNTTQMLKDAVRLKVAYVPGEPFFPYNDIYHCMRLNFSNSQPEQIETGIRRLSQLFN